MGFLYTKELDEVATRAKVREFFEDDFPRLQQQAHIDYVSIKSPVISGMPGGGHYGNATDDKYSMHTQAKMYLAAINEAFEGLRQPYRHFMELRYYKQLTWEQISDRTPYSERQGQNIINEAFIMFAFAFADTLELRVFK
ncbi:ArpU family phage packaging/lysis transcriptional regulator [Weissella confusa]|uniref:ArpU family phage packaging/lysis transcriptional regulator n=1 Tax=Weissella confusa TaxID=1583 RepID=UPI0014367967|nr:ArpU family phage packaging/lysis transcriptional regulator [Weissella confusa]